MITIVAGVLYVCGFYEASRYMLHEDKLPPYVSPAKARSVGVLFSIIWPVMTMVKMAMDLTGDDEDAH